MPAVSAVLAIAAAVATTNSSHHTHHDFGPHHGIDQDDLNVAHATLTANCKTQYGCTYCGEDNDYNAQCGNTACYQKGTVADPCSTKAQDQCKNECEHADGACKSKNTMFAFKDKFTTKLGYCRVAGNNGKSRPNVYARSNMKDAACKEHCGKHSYACIGWTFANFMCYIYGNHLQFYSDTIVHYDSGIGNPLDRFEELGLTYEYKYIGNGHCRVASDNGEEADPKKQGLVAYRMALCEGARCFDTPETCMKKCNELDNCEGFTASHLKYCIIYGNQLVGADLVKKEPGTDCSAINDQGGCESESTCAWTAHRATLLCEKSKFTSKKKEDWELAIYPYGNIIADDSRVITRVQASKAANGEILDNACFLKIIFAPDTSLSFKEVTAGEQSKTLIDKTTHTKTAVICNYNTRTQCDATHKTSFDLLIVREAAIACMSLITDNSGTGNFPYAFEEFVHIQKKRTVSESLKLTSLKEVFKFCKPVPAAAPEFNGKKVTIEHQGEQQTYDAHEYLKNSRFTSMLDVLKIINYNNNDDRFYKVETTNGMFKGNTLLQESDGACDPRIQDVFSQFNMKYVKDATAMFSQALTFNCDISMWEMSTVTDINHMFYNAEKFNQDLSSWDVSRVESAAQFNSVFGGERVTDGAIVGKCNKLHTYTTWAQKSKGTVFQIHGFEDTTAKTFHRLYQNAVEQKAGENDNCECPAGTYGTDGKASKITLPGSSTFFGCLLCAPKTCSNAKASTCTKTDDSAIIKKFDTDAVAAINTAAQGATFMETDLTTYGAPCPAAAGGDTGTSSGGSAGGSSSGGSASAGGDDDSSGNALPIGIGATIGVLVLGGVSYALYERSQKKKSGRPSQFESLSLL